MSTQPTPSQSASSQSASSQSASSQSDRAQSTPGRALTMTHRQRLMAAIRGQPTDQIPWAPRMDLWMISLRARGLLPAEYQGMNMVELSQALGVACHAVGGDFSLPGERDVRLRGLGIDNHRDYPYRVELRGLPMQSSDDGTDQTHAHRDAVRPSHASSAPLATDGARRHLTALRQVLCNQLAR